MNLRITGLRSRFRSRADSFTRSFGSVLALLVLAYWYGEAYGTERWLALPLIAMSFLSIIVALRIVNPVHVHRHLGVMAVATALAALAALIDSQTLMSAPLLLVLFYSCYAFAVILPYVFTRHRVTANVILGAVCVYVLLGSVFATIYGFGAAVNPEIFAPPIDPTEGPQGIGYFSFVTLTTLGFGDIAPAVNWVRGVVVLEALAGQIFLVVLVARLVGMQIAQRPSDDQLPMSGATSSGSEAK